MQSTKNPQKVDKASGARIMRPAMPESVLDFFRATGRIGGSAKSPAKTKAAQANGRLGGKLGGRPRQHLLVESEVLSHLGRASAA